MTEIPASVERVVKKQKALMKEAVDKIRSARISKFDRIQLRRALTKGLDEKMEAFREVSQKILGPDFRTKMIKCNYGQLTELKEMGLQRYAMVHTLMEPDIMAVYTALSDKAAEILFDIENDNSLG